MNPKQYEPRGGKPRTGGAKPRWSKDGAAGAARQSGEHPRQTRPKPWEADRPQGANPGRTPRHGRPAAGANDRGDRTDRRPDWTPRGYNADGTDRRASSRSGRPATGGGRPDWQPRERREWAPREDRAPRQFEPREERPPRRDFGAKRPRRDFDDRPRRDSGDRPHRDFEPRERREHAPREPHADRPQRSYGEERQTFAPTEDVVLERLEAQAVAADAGEGLGFADLGLGQNLVRQLGELGAIEPFPIQAATIPEVLAGRDVLGRGRTGSGKTIAFGAPVVERLMQLQYAEKKTGAKRQFGRRPRAIILAPTRELAQQIDRTVQSLARAVGLFTIAIVGGVPYQKQLMGLRRGADIVIGTPGRIQDLIAKGELDLSEIAVSVLDEADHMCDLGFLEPVQEILRETPDGSQRLLFSATLDAAVEQLVGEFLRDPSVHEVEGEDQASSTITHKVWIVDASAKRDFVKELAGGAERSIVFARTRAFAEELSELLGYAGVPAASLHGDLNQAKRNRSLQALTRGDVRALVATDVAARGIHVDDVDLVVQADMPDDHKTYLHRSGRTGRAGALGTVITVIPPGRRRRMEDLLRNAGIEAEWEDKATTRRPDRDRTFKQDRPYRSREERPARPERKPRMSEEEFAEFQAWKAARDAQASAAE